MLRVSGLEGGHSGQQIDDNLMNALKALGYVLALTAEELAGDAATHVRIADLSGGRADNAIPREACAVLLLDERDGRHWSASQPMCRSGSAHGVSAQTTTWSSRSSERRTRLRRG